MDTSHIESFTRLIQLSVVPAVLISGVGLLLLSFTNRLGRAIDRSRLLAREIQTGAPEEKEDLKKQLLIFFRRTELLRLCIVFSALSIFFCSAMLIGLFFLLFMGWAFQSLILFLFFISIVFLTLSVSFFLWDLFLTLKACKIEIKKQLA